MPQFKSILFILTGGVSDFRLTFAARAATAAGYHVTIPQQVTTAQLAQHDLIVVSRPSHKMCEVLTPFIEAGKPLVVDMDDDFNTIPSHNPAYKLIGPGTPSQYLIDLNHFIQASTILTGPAAEIGRRYKRNVFVIPNSWDETNDFWRIPRAGGEWVNLGWTGTMTHMRDMKIALPGILATLENHKNARIVIGLDYEIYKLFSAVPEKQRIYLPGFSYENYPIALSWFDVMLAPLEDTLFTRSKSAIKLIEAGARGIPAVASPLPQYEEWGAGTLITKDDEWEKNLSAIVESGELRQTLGAAGHEKALLHTAATTGAQWLELIKGLIGPC